MLVAATQRKMPSFKQLVVHRRDRRRDVTRGVPRGFFPSPIIAEFEELSEAELGVGDLLKNVFLDPAR